MPVMRDYEGFGESTMRIDNRAPWRRKLLQLVRTNYGRAQPFVTCLPTSSRGWKRLPTWSSITTLP